MTAHTLARQLFASPGAVTAHTRHLLAQAAGSHARLLDSTASLHQQPLDRLREAIGGYLHGPASAVEKRFLLDEPQLVEALHALAGASTVLTDWDANVAPGRSDEASERQLALGLAWLGSVVVALQLRRSRHWCGQIELATDGYGRVHFPFCDWALVLVDENGAGRDLFAHQTLTLHLDEHEARWSLPDRPCPSLVGMPRRVFDAMFIDNSEFVGSSKMQFGPGTPRARFERATRLNGTRIRFEPISSDAPTLHAELTGGIVAAIVAAIERNAPHIHDQLCQCIRTIHGFELPSLDRGDIASFSVATSPGVIGFNVSYNASDEPKLSPYCFLCLGHEMGHTLHYLIDDVAHAHGWRFLENPGEWTPIIPRYGRRLTVRTLFQIPYAHLFEWWLLMLFHEHGFAGLPWTISEDSYGLGEDLRAEIAESFDLIDEHARLTPTGEAVLARLRELVAEGDSHWKLKVCCVAKTI